MDECFSLFIEDFGPAILVEKVPESFFVEKADILPESLLSFWKEEGWGAYANGLIWTVNPDHFVNVIERWVTGFPILEGARYHVFARTAFGQLFALREDTGHIVRVACPIGSIMARKDINVALKNKESRIQSFFGSSLRKDFDIQGEGDVYLFEAALEKLGALDSNEVYGFLPILAAGGSARLENIHKLQMDVHLDILLQFSERELTLI